MNRLLRALRRFSPTSTEHVELFGKLALEDLGFYVSDADALRYRQDASYPLAEKALLLENAVHQVRYDQAVSRFLPRPWKSTTSDILGCSTLFQDANVTLCWFVIPPGKALPLHDHPGMTVWQRVMHGRLHVCTIASDVPLTGSTVPHPSPKLATVVSDSEVEGVGAAVAPSHILHFDHRRDGSHGVLHEIRNVDPAVPALFVDIISPPYYEPPTNTPCGYYRAEPLSPEAAVPLPTAPADCGVPWVLKPGDKVYLHRREGYVGPAMDAYVHVG